MKSAWKALAAVVAAAGLASGSAWVTGASAAPEGSAPNAPPAPPSVSVAPDSGAFLSLPGLRATYERAGKLRQDSRFDDAEAACGEGVTGIATALALDPDATARRELTDLQGRFEGLRDAIRRDRTEAAAVEPGNEADEKVLNTPAAEEIQPQFNTDVYRWIEFFTGNGRSTFERWLKRSGRYMNLFRAILQREGLPPDLVHLVFVESGFNLNARSVSAAVGPWQFLRSTSRLFGLDVNQWVDERKDPEKSTVAAARYLKHLYSIFGDWPLALASYNAGEGTVLRAIKAQGTTNYWDLRLPRQTEDYVPQFMAVLAISREPGKYGFDEIELDQPMEFDEVALQGAVDLRSLARLAECTVDEIKQLNPAFVRHAVPGRSGVTTIRVPPGKGEILTRKLAEGASLPQADVTVRHRVRRAETLQGIAAQYHVGAQQLARANGIGRKRPLRQGMVLTIPAGLGSVTAVLADSTDPRASTAYVPARSIRPPAQISGQSSAVGRSTHVVRRGETLAAIAEKYGCEPEDIRRWNRLKTATLRRGTRLKIRSDLADSSGTLAAQADSAQIASLKAPGSRGKRRSAVSAAGGSLIVVRSGDTLSGIAKRHGVSVRALREANGMNGSALRAGQRLRLPES